ATASTPEPHWPAISISGSSLSRVEMLLRASGSSSTIRTRSFSAWVSAGKSLLHLGGRRKRDCDRDLDSSGLTVLDVQTKIFAVKVMQPGTHVGDSYAGAFVPIRGERRAIVPHNQV